MEAENPTAAHDAIGASREECHAADLALVRSIVQNLVGTQTAFAERMECIPRILTARNAQLGRPLDHSEVQDVAQDTLVVVWRKLPSFEGRSSIETWVYRICHFELMNAIRRRRRHISQLAPHEPLERVPVDAPEIDDFADLYSALDELERDEAEIVRLKHFDDMKFSDIGVALGIPQNTAKTRYYRALRRLQTLLKHRGEAQ